MCPPGTDYTERWPEEWQVLAPSVKENFPLHLLERDGNALLEPTDLNLEITPMQYLFGDLSWNSWSRLAKPSPTLRMSTSFPKAAPLSGAHATIRKTELAPLECMPAELLALILDDDALEREDVLALGLTSTTLWPHAVQHVRKACYEAAAPWANTPIVCMGNYLEDLPPVLAAENPEPVNHEPSWISYTEGSKRVLKPVYRDRMCWPRKFNRAAVNGDNGYKNVAGRGGESDIWMIILRARVATAKISTLLVRQMEQDITRCEPNFAAADVDWFLRNMTTREFVRCQALSQNKAAHVDHPDSEWIRVDDVLMMRICWTRLDDWRREQIKNQGLEAWERGAWAGHSFEIVALPQGKADAMAGGEEGWRDVTVEVVEQAHRFRAALRKWGHVAAKRRPRVVPRVDPAQIRALLSRPLSLPPPPSSLSPMI